MRGNLFEKVGVNISTVHGVLPIDFRASIPGLKKWKVLGKRYLLVSHPLNPYIPSAHLNTRLIHTSKTWFGGGGDITPRCFYFNFKYFHNAFKNF